MVLVTCIFTTEICQADPVLARWEAYQIEFKYSGFTTAYTCKGIESTLRSIMKGLGARDDVRVEARCHGGVNEPSRFINVQMAFAMPVPAEESEISAESFQAKLTSRMRITLWFEVPRALGSSGYSRITLTSPDTNVTG